MKKDDQGRIIFSTAVIATLFAYLQIHDYIKSSLGITAYTMGLWALTASAILSFLFIFFTASELRFEDPSRIPFVKYDKFYRKTISWFRRMAFDLSIDVFVIAPVALTAVYIMNLFIPRNLADKDHMSLIIFFATLLMAGMIISFIGLAVQLLYLADGLIKDFTDPYLIKLLFILGLITMSVGFILYGSNVLSIVFLLSVILLAVMRGFLDRTKK